MDADQPRTKLQKMDAVQFRTKLKKMDIDQFETKLKQMDGAELRAKLSGVFQDLIDKLKSNDWQPVVSAEDAVEAKEIMDELFRNRPPSPPHSDSVADLKEAVSEESEESERCLDS